MSILAGYDVVIEYSNELLRDLVVANLCLSGTGSSLPFELSIPLRREKADVPAGFLRLRINDVQIGLQTSRPIIIQLSFDNASTKAPWVDLGGLDGRIEIPVYFPYILTKSGQAHIALDLSGIEPGRITFSEGSQERAKSQLPEGKLSYQGFEEIWQETLAAFIQRQPLLLIATGLTITATEGGLSPLRFYDIEAQGFGPAEKSQQALGLFGTLVAAHSYDGTPSFKTTSALPVGGRLALSISAAVFRQLIFFDSVAEAMKISTADLPISCGKGPHNRISRNGCFALSSIEATLEDHFIGLSGVLETDFGALDFRADVCLAIDNGEVRFSLQNLDVSASRSQSGAAAASAQFGALVEVVLRAICRTIAETLTDCISSSLLWPSFDQVLIVKDQGLTFLRTA